MFVVIKTDFSKSFATRDDLFRFLEQENVRVISLKQLVTYNLSHVTDDGELLQQKAIHLPLEDSIDSYLMDFGQKKRGLSFVPSKLSVKEPKTPEGYAEKAPERSVQTKTRPNGHKSFFLGLSLLVLALLGLSYWHHQTLTSTQKEIASIKQELRQVVKNQDSLRQITQMDVFCRYFLPRYYSGQKEQLKEFIVKDMNLSPKEGQLQSVILEDSKVTPKGYEMTYVISLKTSKGQETKRLSLTISSHKKATYGYQVMKRPIERMYP
ncbi:UNVERIFIED_CONTAM: hypothetical protein KB582_11330 [Streptococcus canis]